MSRDIFVARELAPARLRSSRKISRRIPLDTLQCLDWGCFAAQREQAPSPHIWVSHKYLLDSLLL
ncbi:hypothetical protein EMIT0P258_60082 [Pseudomonas sp. IT-P258]